MNENAKQPDAAGEVLCARCEVGVDAQQIAEMAGVLSAATEFVMVTGMHPEEAIRSTVDLLAARGDAATPTVTAEQDQAAARAIGGRQDLGSPEWRAAYLDALGIEVRP